MSSARRIRDDFIGRFGSLDTGSAMPAMRSDRLPYARNIEHERTGAVNKRPGRRPLARVAPAPENPVAPPMTNLGATAGSTLTEGTLYAWLTYSTTMGETDDVHSVSGSVAVAAGDGVSVAVPFHIMGRPVFRHDLVAGTLEFSDYIRLNILAAFADDTFNGWYVTCRDPIVQDETHLGLNPNNYKMWDRRNYLARVADYAAGVFTLDRAVGVDLTGKLIDIRMPDRGGHAIRGASVYVSQSPTGARYRSHSVSPLEPTSVTVTSIPTSNALSPATRITRTAPIVIATSLTDTDPVSGIAAAALSDLLGGEYLLRYVWETSNSAYLDNGGWPEASEFMLMARPRRTTQMAWPSLATRISLLDGQGISVTAPTRPSGVETTHFYLRRMVPAETKSTAGLTSPSSTHRIFKYAGSDAAALTASAASFRTNPAYGVELTTQQYEDIAVGGGTFVTGDVTQPINKFQIEWQHSGTDTSSNSSTCLVVRLKGLMGNAYSAQTAPMVRVRYRNAGAATWVDVRTDVDPTDLLARTLRLCIDYSAAHNDSGRHVWDIVGEDGACFSIDSVTEEAYRTSMATDPAVTTDDIIVEVSTGVAVTIQSAPVAARDADSCIPNTTGQGPLALEAGYVGTDFGAPQDNVTTLVGAADSVFVLENGALERIYSHDRRNGETDKNTLEVCASPWRFASVPGGRAYFCNALNRLGFNLRYDGVATWPDGIPQPSGTVNLPPADEEEPDPDPDPANDCGRFTVEFESWRPDPARGGRPRHFLPGDDGDVDPFATFRWRVRDPDGGFHFVFDYRDLKWTLGSNRAWAVLLGRSGRVFTGVPFNSRVYGPVETKTDHSEAIVKCLTDHYASMGQLDTGAGTGDGETMDTTETEGVDPGVKDYYIVLERRVDTEGRSYVAVSEPQKVATVTVVEKPAVTGPDGTVTTPAGTEVLIHAPAPTDPQATHARIGRNLRDSGTEYRVVERIALTTAALDSNGNLSIVDSKKDADLGSRIDFEVGMPPPASLMLYHLGKRWLVPIGDVASISHSRAFDPEAVPAYNFAAPNFTRPCALTALAPYGSRVVAHGDNGVAVSVGGTSETPGADPFRFEALQSDEGAFGPHCWLNSDSAHFFVSRSGINVLAGSEPRVLSDLVKGTVKKMAFTTASAQTMSCVRYRTAGKHQAWFSYSTRPDGRADRVLVFDLNVGPGFEEDRRLWSDWSEMYAASLCRTEHPSGEEIVLIGDHWGQVYQHDGVAHDAGLHVDAELRTKVISKPTPTFVPRWLVAKIKGLAGAFLNFDVLKDGTGSRANDRLQRLVLRSPSGDAIWGSMVWGDFNWGESRSSGYDDYTVGLGGTHFSQAQFVFSQKWVDQPPGAKRGQTFEMAGFTLESDPSRVRQLA